jgi:hypothetical protein
VKCGVGNFGRQEKQRTTFCEQKAAKKLYYAGPWALSPTTPMAQRSKIFAPLFF